MYDFLKSYFDSRKIEYFSVIDYSHCRETLGRLIERENFTPRSVIIYLLPYLWGLEGIIMTQSAADIFTFLISIPFHIVFVKKVLKDKNLS